ncbi:RibD family protein [Streptosporangium algeriense]|uniref:RibD family protein n=1 Tax=Streptosporangium algeriense TaxID=1682748 RepID=A0ABW3DLI9_9ACTN
MTRPYVLSSVAMSLDGYIDDTTPDRLLLSNDEDFDRVDDVRASVDAILVGAGTVRADNPRLLVRSDDRRKARLADGKTESPIKAVIAGATALDPTAKFFTTGDIDKVVYTPARHYTAHQSALSSLAHVVDAGEPVDPGAILADLAARNVDRLMIEGGSSVHTQFLAAGLVDELHVVIAPFFVGDTDAPRFVNPARFPQDAAHRMRLVETLPIGDVIFARYRPSA